MAYVYVAGSIREISRVKRVQEMVRERGHEITFDWTNFVIDEDGPESTLAGLCVEGVLGCSMLVYVMGREKDGRGALIEVGMAMGMGIPIIVIEPQRHSSFFTLDNVKIVRNRGDFDMYVPRVPDWARRLVLEEPS